MKNVYDLNVPDDVFRKSPKFKNEELVVAAQALGIALSLDFPMLRAMALVASITPNAKLRKGFVLANKQMEKGKSFYDAISSGLTESGTSQYIFAFFDICGYGEKVGKLDKMLLMYANDCGKPFSLTRQIGRSNEVQLLISRLSYLLNDRSYGFLRALEICTQMFAGEFRTVLKKICEAIEGDTTINKAFAPHTQWFDPFFLAILEVVEESVKEEKESNVARAFSFLAMP